MTKEEIADLDKKIEKASRTRKGVDVNVYMDEAWGRESGDNRP